jgi:quinoprotein glucose dehydrogenase
MRRNLKLATMSAGTWAMISSLMACGSEPTESVPASRLEWTHHSGTEEGHRYSAADQISPTNAKQLEVAWKVRMGGGACLRCPDPRTRVEVTPIMRAGVLFVSTPLGHVLAIDASTGKRLWKFDSGLDLSVRYLEGLTTRGLTLWVGPDSISTQACAIRVLTATVDARLHALDAKNGSRCKDFGADGSIDLLVGAGIGGQRVEAQSYSVTSPPLVIGDVVVTGSTVDGHSARPTASGVVRAFDVRTGRLRWSFDPIPRSRGHPGTDEWSHTLTGYTSGGNVWSFMSADSERDLIYLPTASASPNHFGGQRVGRNAMANSIVALRASTGQYVWSFQLVHHDLWDYDTATQPILVSLVIHGDTVPAIVVTNKSGMLFILDRVTGRPLTPIEERSVPSSTVPGEHAWPTQPSSGISLSPSSSLSGDSLFGVTPDARHYCREWFSRLRNDGPFTPPSLKGSIVWPGIWGGPNWDGAAWDPLRSQLLITVRRVASVIQLVPRGTGSRLPPQLPGEQRFSQGGTPYLVRRMPFVAPSGIPCSPPPWSALLAVHLPSGQIRWATPLGVIPALSGFSDSRHWGSIAFGGPLVTASGLVFIAASQDDRIRALSVETGAVVWEH